MTDERIKNLEDRVQMLNQAEQTAMLQQEKLENANLRLTRIIGDAKKELAKPEPDLEEINTILNRS